MLSAMGRSVDGSGHLRKRRDGLYEVRVRRDGKRISYYGQTQGEALRKAEAPKPTRETLHGFLAEWLEKRRGTIRASTWRRYETTVRNSLIPHLPNIRLGALTTSHVEHLNEETLGSASLARKARVVLHTAMEYALLTHRIPTNPCHSRVLRLTVTERDWVILDRDETRRLLEAAKTQPQYEALYVLAVTIGARVGELCALRWQDIDLDAGTLKVTGTINRGEDNRLARLTVKTERARRTIRLPDIAVEALRRTPRDEGETLVGHRDLVFKGSGEYLDPSEVTKRHFADVLRAAGLPPMVMHDLRHTAITHMLESNIMPHTVSEIVGHSSAAFTLSRYASVTRGMHEAAVEATNRRYS
jgi:integrase